MTNMYLIRYAKIISIGIFFFSLMYCTKKNEVEDVYKNVCDTVNVSYTKPIKAIFDSRCVACHSNGAQLPDLDTYANVKTYMLNPPENADYLYTKIAGGQHQGIVLSDCEKVQLRKWTLNPIQ